MYNYICIHIYIYIHVCVYIYIYTYMHALHCIALHYIPRQFSNVHYSTLHYIHYLTLPYLTLHYITLHIYIYIYLSLSVHMVPKRKCVLIVSGMSQWFFLYTHFECLLYSHVLLIFISRGEHVHGIQTYTYMYDLKTLRNTIILLQPSQHTITQTKKNKKIYIYN